MWHVYLFGLELYYQFFIFTFLSFSWWPFHQIFFVFCFAISPILSCKVIHPPPFFPLVFLLPLTPPPPFFPENPTKKNLTSPSHFFRHLPTKRSKTPLCEPLLEAPHCSADTNCRRHEWHLRPYGFEAGEAGTPKWVVVYRDFWLEQPQFLL